MPGCTVSGTGPLGSRLSGRATSYTLGSLQQYVMHLQTLVVF
jgi:hypothetical protein